MTKKNVLIADDDPSILLIVSALLKRIGYHPVRAKHGKEAYHLLQNATIDLLITDETMPYITGIEIARWMRAHTTLNKIPIILLSAEQNYAAFNQALTDKTVDGFLAKPFSSSALTEMISSLLK